jgi:hypothetical protein
MKFSYALSLLAGGFISSGYHTMPGEAESLFFFLGIAALLGAAVVYSEMGL